MYLVVFCDEISNISFIVLKCVLSNIRWLTQTSVSTHQHFHVLKNYVNSVQRLINFFFKCDKSYKFSINILSTRHYKSAVKWKDDVNREQIPLTESRSRKAEKKWKLLTIHLVLFFLLASFHHHVNTKIIAKSIKIHIKFPSISPPSFWNIKNISIQFFYDSTYPNCAISTEKFISTIITPHAACWQIIFTCFLFNVRKFFVTRVEECHRV